ncbi:MAG: TonB-dependent receptor plug domain-containing protein, partial [Woeseia sp.]
MASKRNPPPLLTLVFALMVIEPTAAQAEGDSAILMADPQRTAIAAGVWASEDGSKVTYESQYFEAYQAVTAADMLRWVPGGAELLPRNGGNNNNNNDKRGFGSGGDQILINGKRLSGKSNDIGSAMQRIQANVVSRVELIRGTSPGLDVRSEGTLINVVLSEEISGGAGSWQLHSGFYGDDTELDGLISYSNSAGRLNYLVSAEMGPYNRGNNVDRYEEYFTPDSGILTERREINEPELKEALVLNSSVGWSFANGDMLNLNGRIADRDEYKNETTHVFVVGEPDTATLENTSTEQALEWEFGGDLEQQIGRGVLKTRLIYALKDEQEGERVAQTSSDQIGR